jgi:hypothetical protein
MSHRMSCLATHEMSAPMSHALGVGRGAITSGADGVTRLWVPIFRAKGWEWVGVSPATVEGWIWLCHWH